MVDFTYDDNKGGGPLKIMMTRIKRGNTTVLLYKANSHIGQVQGRLISVTVQSDLSSLFLSMLFLRLGDVECRASQIESHARMVFLGESHGWVVIVLRLWMP